MFVLSTLFLRTQPVEFPNPTAVDPTRSKMLHHLQGTGFHACPGAAMALITIAEIVKVVFGLKNLRRVPGDAGRLKKITTIKNGTSTNHYVQSNGELSMWRGSMHLVVRFIFRVFFKLHER
jgi:linoleate 10R-lipoxygenase